MKKRSVRIMPPITLPVILAAEDFRSRETKPVMIQ
jgi:hypothetical protein